VTKSGANAIFLFNQTCRFWLKTQHFSPKLDHCIGFKYKHQFFHRKFVEIADNSDHNPGANVMITFFGEIWYFRRKNCRFLEDQCYDDFFCKNGPQVVQETSIFAPKFGRKYFFLIK
jgi:hypothetical protein